MATLAQPLPIERPEAAALPRAFILCTADKTSKDRPVFHVIDQIKADAAWRYREVAGDHLAPFTAHQPVATALMGLIEDVPDSTSPA